MTSQQKKDIWCIQTKCEKYNVTLSISGLFEDYHTKAQLQIVSGNSRLDETVTSLVTGNVNITEVSIFLLTTHHVLPFLAEV
jgi:hypothetical protein